MPLKDLLLRIFGKKRQAEGIEATQIASYDLKRIEAEKPLEISQVSPTVELQKDSLQLGIAAGYTGRSLREIESSLIRIESQMSSKDWFLTQFEDRTPELINLFKIHEENAQRRFESIQNILISLQKSAVNAPEPLKAELIQKISSIERQLPLTSKMKELLQIVNQYNEISYDELASKLNISVSALRGLLANVMKRTNEIERFDKNRKGWARYVGKGDLKRIKSLESDDNGNFGELLLRDKFEKIAEKQGFKILMRLFKTSPDFIIEKDGKGIGVELKSIISASSLEKAVGQLLFAKTYYNLQEIWLVIPPVQTFPENWLDVFRYQGIKILILDDDNFINIS